MSTLDVKVHYFRSKEQEDQIYEEFETVRRLLPCWASQVSIFNDGANPEVEFVMACKPEPQYRRVVYTVHASYFTYEKEDRLEFWLHETIHGVHGEVIHFVQTRLLDPLKESDPNLYNVLKAEFVERVEGFTQDFAFILNREIYGERPPRESSEYGRLTQSMEGAITNGALDSVLTRCFGLRRRRPQ